VIIYAGPRGLPGFLSRDFGGSNKLSIGTPKTFAIFVRLRIVKFVPRSVR